MGLFPLGFAHKQQRLHANVFEDPGIFEEQTISTMEVHGTEPGDEDGATQRNESVVVRRNNKLSGEWWSQQHTKQQSAPPTISAFW